MKELTKEQLELAKEEWRNGSDFEQTLRAMATYLQLPWDDPTEEEMNDLGGVTSDYHVVIRQFVRRRNAALLPKPVDPAVEVVSKMLRDRSIDDTFDAVAERIVKAVREAKDA